MSELSVMPHECAMNPAGVKSYGISVMRGVRVFYWVGIDDSVDENAFFAFATPEARDRHMGAVKAALGVA